MLRAAHPVLLSDIRTNRKLRVMYYPLFFARQTLIVVIVFYLRGSTWTQLVCWNLLFLFHAIYLMVARPFAAKKSTLIAIIEDVALLLVSFPLFGILMKHEPQAMSVLAILLISGAVMLIVLAELVALLLLIAQFLHKRCRSQSSTIRIQISNDK